MHNRKIQVGLILTLLLIVILLIGSIFYLSFPPSVSIKSESNLKGYNDFFSKVQSLSKDLSIAQSSDYQKLVESIIQLDNSKLTKDQEKNILFKVYTHIIDAYSATNNHSFYTLQNDFNNFIIPNFPEEAKDPYAVLCFDQLCAPKSAGQLNKIIEEIRNSNLTGIEKEDVVKNLTNFSYLSDTADPTMKVNDLLFVVNQVKDSKTFTDAGLNIKISDEILAYIKLNFPKEYEKIKIDQINLK